MREDFLHYVWQYLFLGNDLKSTGGEAIHIFKKGLHNLGEGADFFNAKIQIEKQIWAGNVEIHLKSSDWYAHNHQEDSNYDAVILHVVWEHDMEIYRKDNTIIPTLELKGLVSKTVLEHYYTLFDKKKNFINCEQNIKQVDPFIWQNWLEKLYFERLSDKAELINKLLQETNNDWEAVLFLLMLKNFGLKINGNAFLTLGKSIDFSIFRKELNKPLALEALLFGQAGMLNQSKEDVYFKDLKKEYNYYQKKYQLKALVQNQVQFFRLRPPNFPTIRLAQLVDLYSKQKQLVAKIIKIKTLKDAYAFFDVATSVYWETHYNFDLESKKREKKLTKSFINLLLINTIIPFQFLYHRAHQITNDSTSLNLMQELKQEKNSIVNRFENLGIKINNAQESQAILQLKNNYCNKHNCLSCAVGNALLK
jgi:hypothetical protein